MFENNRSVRVYWVISIICSLLFVLPARFYNGFYLNMFAVQSNISVFYINLMDLSFLIVTCCCIVLNRKIQLDYSSYAFCVFYVISNALMLGLLLFFGKSDFCGELISKSMIVIFAAVICSTIKRCNDTQKCAYYILPLVILIAASFFLSGYQGYGRMNRTGSIGFGTNETACFACVLLAIGLFVRNFNMFFRIAVTILSLTCLLNVASRRGIIVALAIIFLKFLFWIVDRKDKRISIKKFLWTSVPAVILCILIYINIGKILDRINQSALLARIRFMENINENVLDYSNRVGIFTDATEYFSNNLFLGTYGCDLLYAQEGRSHAHNLLLQILVTHGIFIGIPIVIFIILSLWKALRLIFHYRNNTEEAFPLVVSLFFVIYFIFDSFGYLLWNPKGLLWIAVSVFLINFEYYRVRSNSQKQNLSMNTDD